MRRASLVIGVLALSHITAARASGPEFGQRDLAWKVPMKITASLPGGGTAIIDGLKERIVSFKSFRFGPSARGTFKLSKKNRNALPPEAVRRLERGERFTVYQTMEFSRLMAVGDQAGKPSRLSDPKERRYYLRFEGPFLANIYKLGAEPIACPARDRKAPGASDLFKALSRGYKKASPRLP